jgi:hypothetical protein
MRFKRLFLEQKNIKVPNSCATAQKCKSRRLILVAMKALCKSYTRLRAVKEPLTQNLEPRLLEDQAAGVMISHMEIDKPCFRCELRACYLQVDP